MANAFGLTNAKVSDYGEYSSFDLKVHKVPDIDGQSNSEKRAGHKRHPHSDKVYANIINALLK